MKRSSALFLRTAVILIGIGTLAFLLVMPHFEGRNVDATFFEVYFQDPFLAYVYIASIPFFTALFQVFRLLGCAGRNAFFTQHSVRALQVIQYCGMLMSVCTVGGAIWLLLSETDDRPPVIAMGLVALCLSIGIAVAAAVRGRRVLLGVRAKRQ
ncbi:DUF2975 domain-containing protein [Candidatus Peribacteria bacterium]|nr:MAG: DUF2975 domain-containing protein [Candidatus Peribacteria bacterium]